jgi:ABC-type glycerol-3-phosphate transport system substrate-binding protein
MLLCVFGAFAVAGVAIFAFAVGGKSGTATGPVVIWGTLDKNVFQSVLQDLGDVNPDFLQVTYVQKDADTFMAEVTDALAEGVGPDLMLIRQDHAYSQISRVRLIPETVISAEEFTGAYADGAQAFLDPGGVIALPFLIDPLVLYWNRDMLNASGFSEPPKHWDELYDMARVMTKRTDTGTITQATVSFGQYKNYHNAKDVLAMLIQQAGGSITKRDPDGTLFSALSPVSGTEAQASVAALRFYTEFSDPSKEDYSWNGSLPNARDAFAAGNLGLYYGFGSERKIIAASNPNLNFSATSTTQMRSGGRTLTAGKVYGFAIPRTSKNPNGALTIASSLASKDIGAVFSRAYGMPSARRDVLAVRAEGDLELFNRQALIARTWTDPDPARTADIFRGMIEETTSGVSLVSEAVQKADRQLGALVGQ